MNSLLDIIEQIENREKSETSINELIHSIGISILRFFPNYNSNKSSYIKVEKKELNKTLFRDEFKALNPFKIINISNLNEFLFNQQILNESLLLEIKNFKDSIGVYKNIEPTMSFAVKYYFKNFETGVETFIIGKSTSHGFYLQNDFITCGGYKSFDRYSEKISIENWSEILIEALNNGTINQKLNNDSKELVIKVLSLFFISEAAKNPANYLLAPMFFEVKDVDKDLKFADFPAAFPGSTIEARNLNALYFRILNFKFDEYRTDNQFNKYQALFEEENKLLRKWVTYCCKKTNLKDCIDDLKCLIKKWYGEIKFN